jgi:signal peptidase II
MAKSFFSTGLLLVVMVTLADQATKYAMMEMLLSPHRQIDIAPFFNLTPVWNKGISFGLLKAQEKSGVYLLLLVAFAVSALLIRWLIHAQGYWQACSIGLILGGALGNIIDRVRFGAVFDFLDFHLYGYHYPAFNLADMCIVAGVVMMLVEGWVFTRGKRKELS